MGKQVKLDNVVIDYPHLFVARLYKGNKKYSGTFLFDKGGETDLAVAAAIAEIKAENPGKKLDVVYYSGDEKYPGNPAYAGKMFLRANRGEGQGAPTAYSMGNEVLTAMDQAVIYPGALVNVYVDAYVPPSPNDDIIAWGITAIQHAGDGPRIEGGGDVDTSTLFQPLTTEAKKPSFL